MSMLYPKATDRLLDFIRRLPAVIMAVFLSLVLFRSPALAEFDLSYSLTEGGFQLKLSPDNVYRGVRIQVNSDVSKRYEIVQKIVKPLEHREDRSLTIRDNFVVRGIVGSNRYGSLRLNVTDTPVIVSDVVYVSDAAGDADSFSVLYGITRIEDIQPGVYSGRISFTLNAIGSSLPPVTRILEVEVSVSGDGKAGVRISTASGSRNIYLSTKKNAASSDVAVNIKGNFNRPFSIKQVIPSAIESLEGETLDFSALNFVVRGAAKGSAPSAVIPVVPAPQEVYSFSSAGESDKNLVITYSLADISRQKAGKYRGRIDYILDVSGMQTKIESLYLDIEVERIFELAITPQGQGFSIEFRDLKPLAPPKESSLLIEVRTNTGKPYQVSQDISMDLTNKAGDSIAGKYFTIRTEGAGNKGSLKIPAKQEVKKGSTVLYVSDSNGSADKFKVIYELTCPKEIKAGDYSTNAAFSLLEM